MSDLFGNHIVGFPTRRFKSYSYKDKGCIKDVGNTFVMTSTTYTMFHYSMPMDPFDI